MNTIVQTTEQLQQCIFLATTGSSNSAVASSMLNAMCASPDGGAKLCTDLLGQILSTSQKVNDPSETQKLYSSIFYTLTTIQRALSKGFDESSSVIVGDQCRLDLRQIIFRCVLYIPTGNERLGNVSATNDIQIILPKYLRTKFGIVLSLLIQADFIERWNNAFHELIQSMNFVQANADFSMNFLTPDDLMELQRKDIFLRMMDGFCDEVVENTSYQKNTIIKDIVRGVPGDGKGARLPPQETISAAIIEAIFRIFQWSYPFIDMTSKEKIGFNELQRLPIKAMAVLKRLVSWVDLSLIMNDSILSLLFTCLSSAGPGDDDEDGSLSSQLAVQVIECIKEIVGKGMENDKKINVIMNIKLLEKLGDCGLNLVEVDGTHINLVIKVAELINSVGLLFVPFWELQCIECSNIEHFNGIEMLAAEMYRLVNLFFYVFAYDDIDVSGSVIPLAIRMIGMMEKEVGNKARISDFPFQITKHVPQLMAVMYQQMQYPPDFEFDYEDEDDAEEEMYRSELRKLNQSLIRTCPDENLQFLRDALSKIELPLSSSPTPTIEASLRLVYHYCEGIRPAPGINKVMKNDTFREVLIALHSSDITDHPHREVLILYYSVAVRYAAIFKQRPELLPTVLSSITGTKGLQHDHCRVRSRSCYYLLKLVKALGTLLLPYVETAVQGILGLLSNVSTLPLDSSDSLYLFEAIGLLIGKSGLDEANQCNYLKAVITPHVHRIEAILNDPNLLRDPESFGEILAHNLAGLAYLSKGFSKKTCNETKLVLLETVPVALKVLSSIPSHEYVRDKSMIYLQRMILCLGEKFLTALPHFIELLIEHCTNEDILSVSQLLIQVCFKYKKNAIPVLDGCVLPFLSKCHNSMPNVTVMNSDRSAIPPHLVTEQHSILKIIYAFLHQIVSECADVLLTSTNVSSLEHILRTMGEGAIQINEPVMKKTCVQFFKELTIQWISEKNPSPEVFNVRNGFIQYLLEEFFPGMFDCFIAKGFDDDDAMQYRVIREVSFILYEVKSNPSIDFDQRLVVQNLMRRRCPSDIIEGFRGAKQSTEMEACLKAMVNTLKQR